MKNITVASCTRGYCNITLVIQASQTSLSWLFPFLVSPSNRKTQGTSSPPCGKSTEYLLCPVTQYVISFPLLRKREQVRDIERGI